MARRFRGESSHKVDSKGRVSIPASFRRVIEEGDPDWSPGQSPSVVLVYGGRTRRFIEGYTVAGMNEIDERISRLPLGSKRRRMLEHMFSGQSQLLQIDDSGRLVLSKKLRDKFGITDEAVFVASGDTFQIWEPSAYEEHARKLEDWAEEFGAEDEDFDPLTLLSDDGAAEG